MKRKATQIFSIFGQCEAAAADYMIAQGKLTRIEFKAIPESARYNDKGRAARFAVVVPAKHLLEFNQLCEGLRA